MDPAERVGLAGSGVSTGGALDDDDSTGEAWLRSSAVGVGVAVGSIAVGNGGDGDGDGGGVSRRSGMEKVAVFLLA